MGERKRGRVGERKRGRVGERKRGRARVAGRGRARIFLQGFLQHKTRMVQNKFFQEMKAVQGNSEIVQHGFTVKLKIAESVQL